jgi:hypothetical protein
MPKATHQRAMLRDSLGNSKCVGQQCRLLSPQHILQPARYALTTPLITVTYQLITHKCMAL